MASGCTDVNHALILMKHQNRKLLVVRFVVDRFAQVGHIKILTIFCFFNIFFEERKILWQNVKCVIALKEFINARNAELGIVIIVHRISNESLRGCIGIFTVLNVVDG